MENLAPERRREHWTCDDFEFMYFRSNAVFTAVSRLEYCEIPTLESGNSNWALLSFPVSFAAPKFRLPKVANSWVPQNLKF